MSRSWRTGSSPLARGAPHAHRGDGPRSGLIPARAGSTLTNEAPAASSWAHPRSRGEHATSNQSISWEAGSSPLARGARHGVERAAPARGLIPARAGSTLQVVQPVLLRQGSSPLARGAHAMRAERGANGGLIPARAGSTRGPTSRGSHPRAHPRSRGEHNRMKPSQSCSMGSSPLARGAQGVLRVHVEDQGLIPARAGSTRSRISGRRVMAAHPRSRGEHSLDYGRTFKVIGSSPLARGAQLKRQNGGGSGGLIPARAGSTRSRRGSCHGSWAHPRSRGEHPRVPLFVAGSEGSSPLARGAHQQGRAHARRRGLIPARAGSTQLVSQLYGARQAHPRSRGEHWLELRAALGWVGSSPLARGAPGRIVGRVPRPGLIPARAGSTYWWVSLSSDSPAHPRSRGEHRFSSAVMV